jgi:hypothetical protein
MTASFAVVSSDNKRPTTTTTDNNHDKLQPRDKPRTEPQRQDNTTQRDDDTKT